MTSRRDSLFTMLLMPALAYATPSLALAGSDDTPLPGPAFRTQPGTAELPPRYTPPSGPNPLLRLACWNEAGLRAIAFDSAPPLPGQPSRSFDQLGATRASRAMAIVHLAIFDALNAICTRHPFYGGPL